MAQQPLVVGLVGGIGTGKSQVAEAFARRGARVISGDALAHEALRQPDVKEQVVRRWGRRMLDDKGEVQRRLLAAVVFADAGRAPGAGGDGPPVDQGPHPRGGGRGPRRRDRFG